MISSAIMDRENICPLGKSVTDFSIFDENIDGLVMSYK
jgi:hypothetical protein